MKIVLFYSCLIIFGCHQAELTESEIYQQIQTQRIQKDLSFQKSRHSPIPDADKTKFAGLAYFPIDLSYRFRAILAEYENKQKISILTSTGKSRTAIKYGFFDFIMEARPCTLQVYKILDIKDEYPDYLFVPFRDVTTGDATYPGGRYLDLKQTSTGLYDLDFNLAYNPSCAYGKAGYNCPVPPLENNLEIAIRAGEKNYTH